MTTQGEDRPLVDLLETDPSAALESAAQAAHRAIPGHVGACVAVVLLDHCGDEHPDPNIHELAYTLLTR